MIKSVIMVTLLTVVCFAQSASKQFEKSEHDLTVTYQAVIAKLQSDTLAVRKMREAQRAWISYRDKHLESIFPVSKNETLTAAWGTSASECMTLERIALTRERIVFLKRWLTSAEGDVCAGTRY